MAATAAIPINRVSRTLPTPGDMRSWGCAEVANWAQSIPGISPDNTDILIKQAVAGADLLGGVTQVMLERWGMPGGPALRLMNAVAAISHPEVAAPSSTG